MMDNWLLLLGVVVGSAIGTCLGMLIKHALDLRAERKRGFYR